MLGVCKRACRYPYSNTGLSPVKFEHILKATTQTGKHALNCANTWFSLFTVKFLSG